MYVGAFTCTCTDIHVARSRVYIGVCRARPVRPRRSNLFLMYARIWCCDRAAHVIWCVSVYGVNRMYLFHSGRVLCIRCIVGYNVVGLVGSSVYSVPVFIWGMMSWIIVGRGVLVLVRPCVAYPFYFVLCCCSIATTVVRGVHDT